MKKRRTCVEECKQLGQNEYDIRTLYNVKLAGRVQLA
jgi:hypothetical protein